MNATSRIYLKPPYGLNKATSGFSSAPSLEVTCMICQLNARQEDWAACTERDPDRKVKTL